MRESQELRRRWIFSPRSLRARLARTIARCAPETTQAWRRANQTTLEWVAGNRACRSVRTAARDSAHADDCIYGGRRVVDEVAERLAERGVFLSHGDFYAMTVVERLGETAHGLVRAGCACYTTPEEVERLLAGVRQIVRGR